MNSSNLKSLKIPENNIYIALISFAWFLCVGFTIQFSHETYCLFNEIFSPSVEEEDDLSEFIYCAYIVLSLHFDVKCFKSCKIINI